MLVDRLPADALTAPGAAAVPSAMHSVIVVYGWSLSKCERILFVTAGRGLQHNDFQKS
jgi:hypothetical protein